MSPSEFKTLLAKCGDYTIDDGDRADAQHDAYQFVWGNAYIFAELWEKAQNLLDEPQMVLSRVQMREVLAKLETSEFAP